jgi:hypothetical protein
MEENNDSLGWWIDCGRVIWVIAVYYAFTIMLQRNIETSYLLHLSCKVEELVQLNIRKRISDLSALQYLKSRYAMTFFIRQRALIMRSCHSYNSSPEIPKNSFFYVYLSRSLSCSVYSLCLSIVKETISAISTIE